MNDSEDRGSGSDACSLCGRTMKKQGTLYGHKVCKKCPLAFSRRRELAFIVDYLLAIFAVTVIAMVLSPDDTADESENVIGISVVIGWAVFSLKDAVKGRSPGKLIAGLQVVDDRTGKPAGALASVKRNLPICVPLIGAVFFTSAGLIGLIWIIGLAVKMRGGPRVGDAWAHTRVIMTKKAQHAVFSPRGVVAAVFE